MPPTPGTKLGPYEILAPIGAGGMGEVYRAKDTRLGREVAVKIVPPAFALDPERLRRFTSEAQAVAALNHPNILAIHDIGSEAGSQYLVMEFLDGESLRERLQAGALSTRKATEYAEQIAKGPGRRARQRNRPSRPEARKYFRHPRRPRKNSGFWLGQTDRGGAERR